MGRFPEIACVNLYLLNPADFCSDECQVRHVDGAFSVHASEKLNLEGEGVFDALNHDRVRDLKFSGVIWFSRR